MIQRLLILLFLMLWMAVPKNSFAVETDASKAAVDAFNKTIEEEAKKKIERAEAAEKAGRIQGAQSLMKQAMMLEALRIEDGRISEEKILALKDQMPARERKDWMKRFLQEGDNLANLGLYDLAVDEYEKVFLFEPENKEASKRIDRLRKKFIKEETQSMKEEGRVIDEQVAEHSALYIGQAEELIKEKDYSSAKRILERVLVLDKKNKKAKKLLKEVKAKLKKA